MSSILDILESQLGEGTLQQLGGQLGIGHEQLSQAMPSAVAVLTGALARNAATPDGASALASALDRDHDGSMLDDLAGFFNKPQAGAGYSKAGDGAGILRHMLGQDRVGVEQALAKSSGLDAAKAGQLLMILAPIVMAALGKAKQGGGLGVDDLGGMLRKDSRRTKSALPSGLGGLAASFLDSDGDGDITDDVARMGAGLLGKLFKGR